MLKVSLNLINAVVPAVSKEASRYYLNGVYIEDKDGFRHYTATNGHVLLTAREPVEGEPMESPMIVKIQKAIKTKFNHVDLQIVNKDTVLLFADSKLVFDVIDATYPEYERVIPADTTPKAESYAIFDPEYLEIINKFVGSKTKRPLMETCQSAALWIVEDTKEGIVKKAVLMPMRAED